MNRPEISVVVPVYHVEAFLDRCIESILAQTFCDFELILVDDGSPDNCPGMCDAWAQKDNRIRVIHKENGGSAEAVKWGINAAQGRYIAFADSDDWVEPEFLRTLYDGIEKNKADVAQCNYQRVSGQLTEPQIFAPEIIEKQKIREVIMRRMLFCLYPHISNSRVIKIYKADLLKKANELMGLDGRVLMGDDLLMNFAVFGLCEKIAVLDTPPLYNYFRNPTSIVRSYDPLDRLKEMAFHANRERIARAYHMDVPDMDDVRVSCCIYDISLSDWSHKKRKDEIRTVLKMLDRKSWHRTIRAYPLSAEKICLSLCYWGQIDLMLLLVDAVKKGKGME